MLEELQLIKAATTDTSLLRNISYCTYCTCTSLSPVRDQGFRPNMFAIAPLTQAAFGCAPPSDQQETIQVTGKSPSARCGNIASLGCGLREELHATEAITPMLEQSFSPVSHFHC